MSYILRKRIANSFHELVENIGFSKISITILMKHAKIRRSTFYEYFEDKYDLLGWYINNTLQELIDSNINYLSWKEIIQLTFSELNIHKNFYISCIQEQHEIDLVVIMTKHIQLLIKQVFSEKYQSNQEMLTLQHLLALGISKMAIHRILYNTETAEYNYLSQQIIQTLKMFTFYF